MAETKQPGYLTFTCPLTIEAAGSEKHSPAFSMVAYSGGLMRITGFPHPVVVDLEGLAIERQDIPVRLDHNPRQGVGHTNRVIIENGQVLADGLVSRDTSWARDVANSSRNGFPWQASISAAVVESEMVPAGLSVKVNGRTFTGPIHVVRKSILKEISFVDSGADTSTSAKVAATAKETQTMADEKTQAKKEQEVQVQDTSTQISAEKQEKKAPDTINASVPETDPRVEYRKKLAAEARRIESVRKICAGKHPDVEAKAIEDGWDESRTELEILRAERPKAPTVTVGMEHSPMRAIEAGLCLRATKDEKFVEAEYGRDYLDGAQRYRRMGLVQAAGLCLRTEGHDALGNDAIVKAALSTSSFPALLSNVANKAMLKSYNDFPSTALRWCAQGDLPDFKGQTRARLNLFGGLQEIGPDGEPKHLSASDESATVRLKTQALAFSLHRSDIFNDDLGALTRLPSQFGSMSRRKIDDLVYSKLLANELSDGTTALFSSGNKNYLTGATSALSAEGLRKALETFRKQVDAAGNALGLEPRYLIVPPEREFMARQLINTSSLEHVGAANEADKNNPTYNPFQSAFEIVVEPRLSNTNYTGNSATAWYLACDPAVCDTLEVDYLNGQRTPTISQVGNGSILRIEYEVVFDVEANVVDYRGMVKSKGTS